MLHGKSIKLSYLNSKSKIILYDTRAQDDVKSHSQRFVETVVKRVKI